MDLDAEIVWKLRQIEPAFRRITVDLILQECPTVTEELAEALMKRFSRSATVLPLDAPVPRPAPLVLTPTSFRAWRRPYADDFK